MKRLILVEGLPGTGKTTLSGWIYDLLTKRGESTELLLEDDARIPCNFAGVAGVPIERFAALTSNVDPSAEFMREAVITEHYAYIRLDAYPVEIAEACRRWDMGDEDTPYLSVAEYMACALEWYQDWAQKAVARTDTIVMDSGFLQNPINELLFRRAADEDVRRFIRSLAELWRALHPVCVYLRRASAERAIAFAKQAKGPGWARRIDALLAREGFGDFFERRFALELELTASVDCLVCDVDGWAAARERVEAYLTNSITCDASLNHTSICQNAVAGNADMEAIAACIFAKHIKAFEEMAK